MGKDSKEFAVGIFDALARRRRQNIGKAAKEELHDFWLQILDQIFDAHFLFGVTEPPPRARGWFSLPQIGREPPLCPKSQRGGSSSINLFYFFV
jgi:hypothetical protein